MRSPSSRRFPQIKPKPSLCESSPTFRSTRWLASWTAGPVRFGSSPIAGCAALLHGWPAPPGRRCNGMEPDDVDDDEMLHLGSPAPPLPADDAERLLETRGEDAVPPGYREVAEVLAVLSSPATPDELGDEADAVAAFRRAAVGSVGAITTPARSRHRSRRFVAGIAGSAL